MTSVVSAITQGISNFAGIITSAIEKVSRLIVDFASLVGKAISNAFSSFADTITNIIQGIAKGLFDAIAGIGGMFPVILGVLQDIITKVGSGFQIIGQTFTGFINGILHAGQLIAETILKGVDFFIRSIPAWFMDAMKSIADFFSAIARDPLGWLKANLVEPLINGFNTLVKWIWDNIPDWLKGAFQRIGDFFTKDLVNFFTKDVPAFFQWLSKGFEEFFRDPLGWLQKNLIDPLVKGLNALGQWIWNALPDWLKGALERIRDFFTKDIPSFFEWLIGGLEAFFKDPLGWLQKNLVDPVWDALKKFGEWLWSVLPDWFKGALTAVYDFFSGIVKGLQEFISDPLGFLKKHVADPIWNAFNQFAKWVWDVIPNWFKDAWNAITDFFTNVAKGIVDFFKDPLGWLKKNLVDPVVEGFSILGQWIWNALPDWLKGGLEAIGDFFKGIAQSVIDFFKDPWGSLKNLIDAIWSGLQWIGQKVWEGLNWLWNTIVSGVQYIAKTIWDALTSFGNWLFESITNAFKTLAQTIYGAVTNILSAIGEFVVKGLAGFGSTLFKIAHTSAEHIGKLITGVAQEIFDPIYKGFHQKYTEKMIEIAQSIAKASQPAEDLKFFFMGTGGLLTEVITAHWLGFGISQALHAIASLVEELRPSPQVSMSGGGEIAAEPVGVGGKLRSLLGFLLSFGWHIKPSYILREMAKDARELSDTFTRGLLYGIAIWGTNPMVRLLNAAFRNVLVIELPTMDTILEILRRHMPSDGFKNVIDTSRMLLKLYGYNDQVSKWLISTVDEEGMAIEIMDRFGRPRKIPISLMYTLPSPSDVARMIVRDIIQDPEAIRKTFAARGMNKDIADMYYLLHFRYPPPERLWTFYTRGISGLLWARISPQEAGILETEAKSVGAFIPVSPEKLNFASSTLDNLLKTYMKWHDYARFSYSQGWPSDNLIIIDTLADIPTKIDQRWMVRFGLYELLSERGVKHSSEVREFVSKVVENTAKGKITLDLTNFCRTLQATGLHPYYVPITAVAETINAITDERTLLRTGVVNLFKEGFFNTSSVMKMLTGVLTVSFNVAYFNPESGSWSTGVINVPLRYLEMEARLIGLRAIMDRALDILRDIQRDVLTGYQEFIIETYDEFKEKFTQVINNINTVYASDFKAITGESPPSELTIRFIEEYYKPYVDALSIWRDIWTVRRIRLWTQRWLGWLMYRIGYGVTKEEEIKGLVDFMVKACKLPALEREYISKVMEYMFKLSLREYIPTPPQLATLAEYIKIDNAIILKAFEERGVPEGWRELWKKYIEVRPLADDIRGLLSSYRRLLVYAKKVGKIPGEIEGAVRALMSMVGFTEKEMAIFDLRVTIEEMIAQLKEYVPTPMQMATLSEFVKLPSNLVDMVFEIRNVPPEWRAIWKNYIDIRPLADDVRDLIRTYLRAIEYVEEAKAMEGVVMGYAKKIGFGADEINILQTRVRLEEMIYNSREYIPTPSQLATIVEVLPHAREFFNDVMKRRRVPADWQKLWQEYIDVKPLIDDLKKFLARSEQLYVRFMVNKDDFVKMIKDVVEKLGYTQKEQELLLKIVELERWRNAWSELIGSVERLVSLSEYSPRASKYALGKMYEMIDSLPLPPTERDELKKMWEEYIRNRPVKSEAKTYITQLINIYVDGLIDESTFKKELTEMAKWGFSENELMFYEAQAALRKARKLRIPLGG
jgi:phage-related protein